MNFQGSSRSGLLVLAAAMVLAAFSGCPARAQGKVEAKYEVSLAGLTIGKGVWNIAIGEDDYTAVTNGATVGLIKALGGSGNGSSTVQGKIVAGQLFAKSYLSSVNYGSKNETIRINLANGNVKESSIVPEPPITPDRILVTDEHRKGVSDPMTGALFRVPGNGDVLGPEACSARTSVFDGRMRYDLQLAYKGREIVTLLKGAHIPVVVCSIHFTPIAGYVPTRASIKYLIAERNMDVALATIAGTRVLAPIRIRVPTPVGMGLVEATEFNTVATPKTN
ncbi:MAG: DUF3108 domain-containing protein [Xanthobacteraceae bacterium]|nr:DUF3108 domain-containing protein [Xanthobacteraceae bacterium]